MPERIPRPPVRLAAGLPGGLNNGTGAVAKHFLGAHPADLFAVVKFGRKKREHDDEKDEDVAKICVRMIEFPGGDGQAVLEGLLFGYRDERGAADLVLFPVPAPDLSDLGVTRDLQHRIEVWATTLQINARERWTEYFGVPPGERDAPVGPSGAASLAHLREFYGARVESWYDETHPDDAAADAGGEDEEDDVEDDQDAVPDGEDDEDEQDGEEDGSQDGEADARHAVAATPAARLPEPEWSDPVVPAVPTNFARPPGLVGQLGAAPPAPLSPSGEAALARMVGSPTGRADGVHGATAEALIARGYAVRIEPKVLEVTDAGRAAHAFAAGQRR